uniref:Nuclear cap-binding protein subunit 3 n=1 Tax=Timema californicum TaxID=61474 RepID=A0A7R9P3Z8_TIMCA|nr:unnamed protein product [Timema californicum]
MATKTAVTELPNLKIEIENDFEEAMDTDDGENSVKKSSTPKDDETEEGEISDSKETEPVSPLFSHRAVTTSSFLRDHDRHYENKPGGYVTNVDIFGKEEQNKLEERAKRFGLDLSDQKQVTDQQLKDLYTSLKMEEDSIKHYRLNSLHMRGTETMSTQDIFNYFKDYGPATIEWINDYTCNAVWLDDLSAARALIGLSWHIKGLDKYHSADDSSKKDKDSNDKKKDDKEIVVVVQEVEHEGEEDIMVIEEHKENITKTDPQLSAAEENGAVNAADIKVPIPPGPWRKGVDHPKAKCILLRFSTRTDKKARQAEKLSITGLITASRKRRYLRKEMVEPPAVVFEDDLGDDRDFQDNLDDDSKNPWGSLAQSWNRLDQSRGRIPVTYEPESPPRRMTTPPSPVRNSHHLHTRSILQRIGNVAPPPPVPPPTTSDDSKSSQSETSDDETWTRRNKAPRMRMYADDEQMRVNKRKAAAAKVQVHKVNSRHDSSRNRRRSPSQERERDLKPRSREDLRSRLVRDGKGRNREPDQAVNTLSSVWTRLRQQANNRSKDWEENSGSGSEWESDQNPRQAEESDEDEDSDPVRATKTVKESGFTGVDLRSKLNMKKSMKQVAVDSVRQKSPLRIEIDNDEYYRLIDSDQE